MTHLGIATWRACLFEKLKGRLCSSVLDKIRVLREEEYLDKKLVGGIIQSYRMTSHRPALFEVVLGQKKTHPLKFYQEDFEAQFLRTTRGIHLSSPPFFRLEFYTIESSNFIFNGVSPYMKKAQERILMEERIARELSFPEDSIRNVCFISCLVSLPGDGRVQRGARECAPRDLAR